MQEPAFVRQVVNLLQEGSFHIVDNSDLVVSASCLQYCCSFRKLSFSIQNVFKKEDAHSSVPDYSLVCCITSALCSQQQEPQRGPGAGQHSRQDSTLGEPAFVTWCNQLRHPSCRLQRLGINNVSFSGQSSHLFEVLFHQPDLKYLSLTLTKLSQELALVDCELSPVDCEVFAFVLTENKKLKYLNVSCNHIDEGVRHV
ncbi:NACHT, LRR and PYD domains-containing protein 4 [Plecturocebus cupreus]